MRPIIVACVFVAVACLSSAFLLQARLRQPSTQFRVAGVVLADDGSPILSDVLLDITEELGVDERFRNRADRSYTRPVNGSFNVVTGDCVAVTIAVSCDGYMPEVLAFALLDDAGRARASTSWPDLKVALTRASEPTKLIAFELACASTASTQPASKADSGRPSGDSAMEPDAWRTWLISRLRVDALRIENGRIVKRSLPWHHGPGYAGPPVFHEYPSEVRVGLHNGGIVRTAPYSGRRPSRQMIKAPTEGYMQETTFSAEEVPDADGQRKYFYFHCDGIYGRAALTNAWIDERDASVVRVGLSVELQPDGSPNLCWPVQQNPSFEHPVSREGRLTLPYPHPQRSLPVGPASAPKRSK